MKVLSFLLVVGLAQSAPQSSQQQVISQVLSQLQPTIARTVSQILIGNRASSITGTTSSGLGQAVTSSSYGQGATSALRTSSEYTGQGFSSFGERATGAVRTSSTSSQSGLDESQLTSSVVASLQPSIAAAVAEALRSNSKPATTFGQSSSSGPVSTSANTLTEEEEAEINAKLSAGVQYEYGYKVADDDAQAYMAHQEVRNGQNVEGKYNYVDANGALVTVTYQAGPDGYTENREVQDDAVQMRNIPGPWEGPYADTVPAGVSVEDVSQTSTISARGQTTSSSSAVSQSAHISQILSALQPQINTAVQSALSSSTRTVSSSSTGASVGSSFNSAQRSSVVGSRQSNQQSNLITNIIGTLQPQISGAVQAALSSRRPAPVAPVQQVRRPVRPVPAQRVVAPAAATSGITGIFGVAGENTVRIETPEFTIGY